MKIKNILRMAQKTRVNVKFFSKCNLYKQNSVIYINRTKYKKKVDQGRAFFCYKKWNKL